MKLYTRIMSAVIAVLLCVTSLCSSPIAFASDKTLNSLGYEISEWVMTDDFEDGTVSESFKLYTGPAGSGNIIEENGFLTVEKSGETSGHIICNISLNPDGSSLKNGQYFFELDITKSDDDTAYIWLSHLEDLSSTSSTDYVRIRLIGNEFTDDKSGESYYAASDETNHISVLADIDESKYYIWINDNLFVSNSDSLYASTEGINSLRLVLPYATGSSVCIDNLKVYKIAMSDELSVERDLEQLTMDDLVRTSADSSDISLINSDLYLPKSLRNGSEVTWFSSDENVISTEGDVAIVSQNTKVTLTAVVRKGEYSSEKKFVFTVVPPSMSKELEYEILSKIFEDDFNDGALTEMCSYSGEAQGRLLEKNGALQLSWNSTIAANTEAKVDFSKFTTQQKNAFVCVEADIKKTTKATSIFKIGGSEASLDIVRIVFADGKLYDEANGEDSAAKVSNGYFNHVTVIFDIESQEYYLWINGEIHSYRKPFLYSCSAVGAFRFALSGGKGAHYAAIDDLTVYTVDASDYLDAQNRVRFSKDFEALSKERITEENSSNIKMSLNLMSKGDNGSDIKWETSDSDVIDISGRVTRPRENDSDKTVTLTATVSHGAYTDQKEFEFTVAADEAFTDPEIMTDEEFFGVWDKTDKAFIKNGKIDYSYSDNLKPTLECVKKGDYDGAKEELLKYFKNRTPNHIYDSADRNNLVANLFADGWLFSGHNYYGGYMFAQNELSAVEADVLANHIIPGDYNSLNVAAWHNEASVCKIYGADSISSYRPKLEVKVNGKKRVYEAIEDAVVSAGKYMESHVDSNNEILCIRKFGGYLCDDETTALFKFDLRDLDVSATIESAKLILTCITDSDSPEGKKLFIMREPTNSWSGDSVRWCDVNGYIYNNAGLPEDRHWDQWAPFCNNEYGKQINRFYPVEQTMIEYRMTKNEKYAYQVLRAAGDYINDWGSWTPKSEPQTYGHFEYDGINIVTDTTVRGQYPRTLDSNGRMVQLARTFDILCDSESVNEEYSTAILKHVWDIAHSLRVHHTLEKHNWQMIEMQGIYIIAEIFPEFRDCLGDDGENWQTYSFNVLEDYIVDGYLEDGTYGEDTGGYSQGVLKSFSDIMSQMKKCGYQLKPENKERLRSATYYNLLLRAPDGTTLAYGDEAQIKGSGKGEEYTAFSDMFSDTELKYVDSYGRYGTEPSWTSRHYPIGKTTFMRSNWSTNSPYLFTVNRGDIDPSHSHCDDNSVVVYAYGNTLLSDQGIFNYETTPEKIWGISSEGHNTVTINDKNQVSNVTNGYTHQWTAGSGFDYLRQSTYTNIGYDHQRSIFFAKPSYAKTNYWIVSDLILADNKNQNNTYKQHWHMRPDALISGDEASLQLRSNFTEGGNIVVASADADTRMKLEDGFWSYNYGNATETKWGYFEKTAQGDATLNTVLLPYETGEASVSCVRIGTGVADTTATALRINIEANNEVMEDYYYVSYESDAQPRSFADYSTDGNVAYVSTDESGDIRQLSLANGTYIKHNERDVVNTANEVTDINVEISDGTVYIGCSDETDLSQLSLNLGCDISNVYVNGYKTTFNTSNGVISITGLDSSDNSGFIGEGVVDRGEISKLSAPSGGSAGGGAGGGSIGGGVGGIDNNAVFTDIAGHWAEQTIIALYNRGIIKGKTQATYCPQDTISRAEAIALIVRTLNISDTSHIVVSYDDVNEDDWFYSVVRDALAMGIISSDTLFRPYDSITRQEMAKLIVNAYELSSSSVIQPAEFEFTDAEIIDEWAKSYVSKGVGANLIKGMDDGSFSPKRSVTRAEAAVFISRLP